MTRTDIRACLFGGALFAAGIGAGQARADRMAFSFSVAEVRARPVGGTTQTFVQQDLDGPLGCGVLAYDADDLHAVVTCNNTEISLAHARPSNASFAYSSVSVNAEFFALGEGPFELQWDLGTWQHGFGYISGVTVGGSLIDFDASINPAGSWVMPLVDGQEYAILAAVWGDTPGEGASVSLRIVEPCAADIDGNGVLNLDDIAAFVQSFLGGCS
ncbi:MAG: hypothetical protein R3B49_11950 [Phycisphaerales bacterium]